MSFGSHHYEEANRSGKVNVHTGNANSKTSRSITSPLITFQSHQYEEAKRADIPLGVANNSSSPVHQANLPPQDRFKMVDYSDVYDTREDASTKHSYSRAPKRNRSPQPLSTAVLGPSSVQLDPDREMLAKARRLARFNVELSQPTETLQNAKHHTPESKLNRASLDKMETDKLAEARSLPIRDNFSEMGSLEFSSAVVGLCQDMCPESEREERERKGDLDKYERLDGERHQTSKYLAVKKYNRTAEREANLIRPMPVLQKTMDYLLTLLNQPYNEDFLNIYNFLWDRMRAIRMDLRMQHYFNHQAIIMLEQMIRLHIVAMHELCEYNKGEGFSEGFDAHLNIEQMNKASVELFQMYDDHRKKGIYVPTENEFRGYYALLKLDKHPGYKVEPAELSLDLAKMSFAIRFTPQIIFARDVARPCRIGNYIAFFRLARKATYLQACLMHAHFAKVRRHALASLHSGLQNNQGIPVTDIVGWLGLEEEDAESLLEYHGFVLKKFEETYMVKEGPFLNSDTDFPTKRSQLVHLKRSQIIIHDIYSDPTNSHYSEKIETKSQKSIRDIHSGPVISDFPEKKETGSNELEMLEADAYEADTLQVANNDVIHDGEADTGVGALTRSRTCFDMQTPFLSKEIEVQALEVFQPHDTSVANDIGNNHAQQNEGEPIVESERETSMYRELSPRKPCADIVGDVAPVSSTLNSSVNNSSPQMEINREHENKEHLLVLYQKSEVADEKLIMFFRKWKRVARKSRESREQRIMLANAAFNSLSVGAPVRQYKALPSAAISELNIYDAATKRYKKQSKSWSTINVAELAAPVLSSRNPDAKCLCWKLLILVQPSVNEGVTNHVSSRWLLSKVMSSSKENEMPIVSVPHLSIWRSWTNTQLGSFYNCCLAIIREATFVNYDISDDDAVTGASSVIFHVSENIPWEIQKVRLHNVLSRIPSGSSIPLLIVSGDAYTEETTDPSSTIIRRLGLHDVELTGISSFLVVFLYGSLPEENHSGSLTFLKDDQLRMGLLWLANYSPLQPPISLMKTREVVSCYLIYSTEVLEYADTSNFGPNQCISIFNAALDRLVQEISRAASFNVNHWPSPEVDLLEKSSYEHAFVDMHLPSVGWSSPSKIQPLIEAIKACKLPEFSNDISWLKKGSYMGLKIPLQKTALEECLISYMTESCQMLGSDLAAREARIMVQTGADLELCGSFYYIIPRWLVIFRRIQNWRLNTLTTGLGTVAYLSEQHQDSLPKLDNVQRISAYTPYSEKADLERLGMMHSFATKLSFDEIAEVLNYKVPLAEQSITLQEPSSPTPVVDGDGEAPKTDTLAENNDADLKYSSSRTGELQLAITLPKMDDRLAMLLEKVTKRQDRIDKQLSFYF